MFLCWGFVINNIISKIILFKANNCYLYHKNSLTFEKFVCIYNTYQDRLAMVIKIFWSHWSRIHYVLLIGTIIEKVGKKGPDKSQVFSTFLLLYILNSTKVLKKFIMHHAINMVKLLHRHCLTWLCSLPKRANQCPWLYL